MSTALDMLDAATVVFDLGKADLRSLNTTLQALTDGTNETFWSIVNPRGAHAIAVGITTPITITIDGHAGYYCAGMNDGAKITVTGNVGTGVAENMMSGLVHVMGDASQAAGATAHGGLLIIEGNASPMWPITIWSFEY